VAINNKDIEELLNEGIIDAETKSRITNYYARKQRLQPSKLLLIFGILASVLVGLGIILIMAHNWDNLSKSIKTAIAFLPLLTSQALCFYTIKEKSESKLWKENCSVLLFLSVAAAIALTSQIYQIEGNERSFLVTWFLITIPIIYLMPSKALSLILISGVIRLLREGPTGIGNSEHFIPLDQLGIFLLVIPFYLLQIKNKDNGLSIKGHHWLVVGAILSMILPSIFDRGTLGLLFALCLFACLYGLGKLKYFTSESLSWNPYLVVGAIGTVITLYISTFINFWEEQEKNPLDIDFNLLYDLPILLIIGLSIFLLYKWIGDHNLKDINPIHLSFLLFFIFIKIYILDCLDSVFD